MQKLTVLPLLTYFVWCFAREKVRLFTGDRKKGGGGYGGNELALKKTLRAVGLNGMGRGGFF